MKKYMFLYKGIEIGLLEVDEEKNLHKYTAKSENISGIKEELIFPVDFAKDTDWVSPIPFFNNRIKNALRFDPEATVIGYHTDNYRLVLIK